MDLNRSFWLSSLRTLATSKSFWPFWFDVFFQASFLYQQATVRASLLEEGNATSAKFYPITKRVLRRMTKITTLRKNDEMSVMIVWPRRLRFDSVFFYAGKILQSHKNLQSIWMKNFIKIYQIIYLKIDFMPTSLLFFCFFFHNPVLTCFSLRNFK